MNVNYFHKHLFSIDLKKFNKKVPFQYQKCLNYLDQYFSAILTKTLLKLKL